MMRPTRRGSATAEQYIEGEYLPFSNKTPYGRYELREGKFTIATTNSGNKVLEPFDWVLRLDTGGFYVLSDKEFKKLYGKELKEFQESGR